MRISQVFLRAIEGHNIFLPFDMGSMMGEQYWGRNTLSNWIYNIDCCQLFTSQLGAFIESSSFADVTPIIGNQAEVMNGPESFTNEKPKTG